MKDTGGNAFPENTFKKVGDTEIKECNQGMTLRDYFAGNSPYTSEDARDVYRMMNTEVKKTVSLLSTSDILSQMNYNYADAMIKERNNY